MATGFLRTAIGFAYKAHSETNHLYDGDLPYSYHLKAVDEVALRYRRLVGPGTLDNPLGDLAYWGQIKPEDDDPWYIFERVRAACYLHDVIEDCRVTYNDVKKVTDTFVADIVYACTNLRGKNRAERANEEYYRTIIETKFSPFVKLCDRIANMEHSIKNNSRMLRVYREEAGAFCSKMSEGGFRHGHNLSPMTDYIMALCQIDPAKGYKIVQFDLDKEWTA